MKDVLRIPEVAREIGVHPSTLQRWCVQGKGPRHIKTPGGTHIFRAQDVASWLASLQQSDSASDRGD
jgi:DNA-binding transcriptional MerR regulator